MLRNRRWVRVGYALLAVFQMASPGVLSIADAAAQVSDQAVTHVEATSSASCPVVHSPDCGMCRVITMASNADAAAPSFDWSADIAGDAVENTTLGAAAALVALPFGRAPPTV